MNMQKILPLALLLLVVPVAAAQTCLAGVCATADAPSSDNLVQALTAPTTCQGSECVILWRVTVTDCVILSSAHANHPADPVGTGTWTEAGGFSGNYVYAYYSYGVLVMTGPCSVLP